MLPILSITLLGGGLQLFNAVYWGITPKTPYNLGNGSQGITFEGDSTNFLFQAFPLYNTKETDWVNFVNDLGWTNEQRNIY